MKKNSKSKNRRAQAPKTGNEAYMRGMQELRSSNAAGFHKPNNAYVRKPKHFKGYDHD